MPTSFITREHADSSPSLSRLTPEQRRSVIQGAALVYRQIRSRESRGNPFVDEGEIRVWGERQDPRIGPEAMTAALSYLAESGQIYAIAADPAPLPEEGGTRAIPLDEMTLAELRERAAELEIEGRSKMSERQLRNRIRKAEAGEDAA